LAGRHLLVNDIVLSEENQFGLHAFPFVIQVSNSESSRDPSRPSITRIDRATNKDGAPFLQPLTRCENKKVGLEDQPSRCLEGAKGTPVEEEKRQNASEANQKGVISSQKEAPSAVGMPETRVCALDLR
jgi:hypothetical protein